MQASIKIVIAITASTPSCQLTGLFQNAIIQSGSPLAYWSYYRQNDADLKERFKQIASLANCSGGADDDDAAVNSANALNRDNDDGEEEDEDEDVKAMVACLRTLNRKHIFTNIYVAMGVSLIRYFLSTQPEYKFFKKCDHLLLEGFSKAQKTSF